MDSSQRTDTPNEHFGAGTPPPNGTGAFRVAPELRAVPRSGTFGTGTNLYLLNRRAVWTTTTTRSKGESWMPTAGAPPFLPRWMADVTGLILAVLSIGAI